MARMRLADLPEDINEVSAAVVDAAIAVHRALGPGLLENAYRVCLAHELTLRGFHCESEAEISLVYRGVVVPVSYRADILVAGKVVVELKCADAIAPEHEAQLLT